MQLQVSVGAQLRDSRQCGLPLFTAENISGHGDDTDDGLMKSGKGWVETAVLCTSHGKLCTAQNLQRPRR
ncbi:hypothetical protein BaRGS_00019318 [Batillaria attramentaria]|uniref:Uncharacterized protein n=1 Tax=Batillaria attramentaria TaxID=370345 RepID=A0ABD0KQE5_9CAEN